MCQSNRLHHYKIIRVINGGLHERCLHCGDHQFFPHNTPSWKYIEYHIREALQTNDPMYEIEYGKQR